MGRACAASALYIAGFAQPVRDLARRLDLDHPVGAVPAAVEGLPQGHRAGPGRHPAGSSRRPASRRIAAGFVGGSLIGIPIGLAIGSFPIVRRLLEPYTEFLRFIPATAHDHRRR